MTGIARSAGGAFPSGSFQTNRCPLRSSVVHDRVRAAGGTRRAYGIRAHRPSAPQFQPWNGHTTTSPLISPRLRSPPMCRQ
jgi:hypothetical protein